MPQVDVTHALEIGLQRHREHRLAETQNVYRQILAAQPRHADALHLLGLVPINLEISTSQRN